MCFSFCELVHHGRMVVHACPYSGLVSLFDAPSPSIAQNHIDLHEVSEQKETPDLFSFKNSCIYETLKLCPYPGYVFYRCGQLDYLYGVELFFAGMVVV